jgi:hypothetical protein
MMPRRAAMPRRVAATMLLWTAMACPASAAGSEAVSLEGKWSLEIDRNDEGVRQSWWKRDLQGQIPLPGSMPAAGLGDDVTIGTKWTGGIVDRSFFTAPEFAKYREPGRVKTPFWLQPEKHYVGPAWYQRGIDLPQAWEGKWLVLHLERPHWATRVWLDGRELGSNDSLSTPHEYDLGVVEPGIHRLTVRVDNRMIVDVGENAHSMSDHTQGNWNGIVGRMELRPCNRVWIRGQEVFARNDGTVQIRAHVGNSRFAGQCLLSVAVRDARGAVVGRTKQPFRFPDGPTVSRSLHTMIPHWYYTVTTEVRLAQPPRLWSEFSPELYTAEAQLEAYAGGPSASPELCDTAATKFGFREIATRGTQFVLNGRKTFFRGTLECCIFPKTGHPPTDVESWKRIVRIAKAHGLNMIRFHSFCPPEAAFVAADELGFYYQVECNAWAEVGLGKPIDAWLYRETERILRTYGSHPSFLLMPYGNEPSGKYAEYLAGWVSHFKKADPRRLFTSASGWPQIAENQFHVTPDPRVQAWGAGLSSRINALPPETTTDYRDYIRARKVPVISHEIGQWCVYPNFDEIPKYTGYLKPKNFEVFRDILAAHHLADQARQFLLASGKLQTLCYKEDIESALRTPGMGGFQLLDLHDFPGQGTALVGVLDPFWEGKGYVTAEEYRRFCNSTVPLARLKKRVFTGDETLHADLEAAHFGREPLAAAVAAWKLVDASGVAVADGKLAPRTVPVDNGIALGSIDVKLAGLAAPARYKLVVAIDQTPFENDWDVWVYPPRVSTQPSSGILIVDELTDKAVEALRAGGKVLLAIPPKRVRGDQRGKVALGFSSIFWNTAWTNRQPPHTLGILCDPKHPALAAFPTEYHSNWQWWYIVSQAQPMILDALPPKLRPSVQVIDDWFTARRLGLVFEARVAGGKLLVSSVDWNEAGRRNPVARQLLSSLLAYMAGERFQPAIDVPVEQIRGLASPPSAMERLGVRVHSVDGFEPGYEPDKAIDGDVGSFWHTAWTPQPKGMPHEIVLRLAKPAVVRGLSVLPRQDGNPNGTVKDYACYVSLDGTRWGEPVAQGTLAADAKLKTIEFVRPQEARFVRLAALSGTTGGPWTSIAELELLVQ